MTLKPIHMSYKQHKQHRLPGYDYSSSNDYFITINTKNKIHHFGEITNIPEGNVMHLSAIGEYLKQEILAIPSKYPGVELGEWIIMPNHVHLIITLPGQNLPDINQNAPRRVPTKAAPTEVFPIETESSPPKTHITTTKKRFYIFYNESFIRSSN